MGGGGGGGGGGEGVALKAKLKQTEHFKIYLFTSIFFHRFYYGK